MGHVPAIALLLSNTGHELDRDTPFAQLKHVVHKDR
jgi:hypothetical protein